MAPRAPGTPSSLRSHISLQPTHSQRSRSGHASGSTSHAASAPSQPQGNAHFDDDDDSDTESLVTPLLRRRIDVGAAAAWDDSEDDADSSDDDDAGAPLALSRHRDARRRRRRQGGVLASSGGGASSAAAAAAAAPESYLTTLRRSSRARQWLRLLTHSSAAHASLSAPHVSANLFAASLHPGVLLSMPHYFARTGTLAGAAGLLGVAILGGAGGGLWVVLSRYVKGKTVEAITGESFGKHTRWKGNVGRAVAGVLLATYATGAAVIAYFGE
jgi:hypothetical protein